MITCNKCGFNQIPDGGLHCPQCGSPVDAPILGGMPAAAPAGEIPWKQRDTLGFFEAFKNTVIEVFTRPAEFYQKVRKDDDWLSPILYVVIIAWIAGFFSFLWSSLINVPLMPFMKQAQGMGAMSGMMMGTGFQFVFTFLLAPLWMVIVLFIWSGLVHLAAMVFGDGEAGFEVTFKAAAYAITANLLNIIPFCGGLIGGIWGLVLLIIGLKQGHKCETWKAVMAPLVWVILIGICCVAAGAMMTAGIMGMMQGAN
jgi:hypothetical protein